MATDPPPSMADELEREADRAARTGDPWPLIRQARRVVYWLRGGDLDVAGLADDPTTNP